MNQPDPNRSDLLAHRPYGTAPELSILLLDPDGVIMSCAGGVHVDGYPPEEILGRHFSAFMTQEDRVDGKADELLAATAESGQIESEGWRIRRDGTRYWASVVTSALRDLSGNLIGFVRIAQDLAEHRQLEAQLRQMQKIEAVGQLAGGIAHDFNNLLTAIRGHVDLLLAEVPLDSRYRHDIDEIRRGADRAATLTQQLLAFSRRQILQPRVLVLDRVIADAERLITRIVGTAIQLVMDLRAGATCVHADRGRIEQVLAYLAVNARDAMPQGGVVTIRTAVVQIGEDFVRANAGSRAGTYVQLDFEDTGSGMDAETLSHMFEPFFTTKALGQGSGLGLATVYGIVKQSDGYIRVFSEQGAGTRIEILLPVVEAAPEPPTEQRASSVQAVRNATVLVAEDEDAVRALACRILRKHGYHVLEAKHGTDALELARVYDERIDLLLTDIVMPQMGGRELGEKLIALRPNLKVVYMSGYTSDVLLRRGVDETAGGILEKPFTPDALVAKVREVLTAR